MKPRKSDVEAVMVAMEKDGHWQQLAGDLAHANYGDIVEEFMQEDILDAALRRLLREKDKVIRAARKVSSALLRTRPGELDAACVNNERLSRFEDAAWDLFNAFDPYDQARRERARRMK